MTMSIHINWGNSQFVLAEAELLNYFLNTFQ